MTELITLRRWASDDLAVLERSNTPEMTSFLGGPESAEALANRNARFLSLWESGEARMFAIESSAESEPVGSVGYWKKRWHDADADADADADVYETGWSVATAYQGRGIASRALAACLAYAAKHGDRDQVVAFPRVDNTASNALCSASGFVLHGEEDFEYPKGTLIRSNVWVFDLTTLRSAPPAD